MRRFTQGLGLIGTILLASMLLNACGGPVWNDQQLWGPPVRDAGPDSGIVLVNRELTINQYLKDHPLAPIEGVWLWSDNKYEVAIMRRPPNMRGYEAYDFVGLITDTQESGWRRGDVKLALKQTATPTIYSGVYRLNGEDVGTPFILSNNNLLEVSIPVRPYGVPQKVYLIRAYPTNQPGMTPTSTAAVSEGTGFFIRPNVVVTNYHVVADAKKIVLNLGKTKIDAELLMQDPQNDLAILRPRLSHLGKHDANRCLAMVEESRPGQKVYVLGYPLADFLGKGLSISEGIVNASSGLGDDPRIIRISVPIQPGNSGSPLFNDHGQVIGVVSSTVNNSFFFRVTNGVVPQNLNFAIKSAYLKGMIAMLPPSTCGNGLAHTRALDAETIRRNYEKAVVRIEAER